MLLLCLLLLLHFAFSLSLSFDGVDGELFVYKRIYLLSLAAKQSCKLSGNVCWGYLRRRRVHFWEMLLLPPGGKVPPFKQGGLNQMC